eukprot:TRINITY_DN13522_c0_g1_i1.p1 TRINITY_DN13522_c0_g1~~TRINITY_DN13522_c0_g1_i1.p1  ORF type:complete len:260 (-),score=34.06 TRINITY_DN13522_c0_g1_i1:412-1191(-)
MTKALLMLLSMPALAFAGLDPWRIMPVGDSITVGVGHEANYRCPLAELLKINGVDYKFVGPLEDRCGNYATYKSSTIHQLAEIAAEWCSSYAPDVVTLQVGTNDLFFYRKDRSPQLGADPLGAIARLETLFNELYGGKRDLLVALSTVTQINATRCEDYDYPEAPWHPAACPPGMSENIKKFNAMLPAFVARQQAAEGRNVVLHDVNADMNWEAADYHTGGIQFSKSGYAKIARDWFSAIFRLAPSTSASALLEKGQVV